MSDRKVTDEDFATMGLSTETKHVPLATSAPDPSQFPVPMDANLVELLGDDLGRVAEAVRQAKANMILGRTPAYAVHNKTGKGGTYDYVKHSWVEQQLNLIFGWRWSFEITWQEFGNKWVIVRGRLTVHIGHSAIVKEQYGRHEIFFKRDGTILDPGNELKAASSDALKKCASLLGIAADVYAKREDIEATFDPQLQEVVDYFPANEPESTVEEPF